MPQPPAYNRGFDFTGLAYPALPEAGVRNNAEMDAISRSINAIRANLLRIQRDDGALKNQSVTPESISSTTLQLFKVKWDFKGPWATATAYAMGDVVVFEGEVYVAAVAHTADVFATDYAADRWAKLTTFTVNGVLQPESGGTGLNAISSDVQGFLSAADVAAMRTALGMTSIGAGLATAADSAAVLALLTYKDSEAGAASVSLFNIIRDMPVTPRRFGAVGDGATDDRAALQAMINTGRPCELDERTYRIGSALTLTNHGQVLVGAGQGTRIVTTSATDDIFRLGDGTNEVRNLTFRDFLVWSTVAKTAGWAFNNRFAARCVWENVFLGSLEDHAAGGHKLYGGYYFDRFSDSAVLGGAIVASGTALACRGNADQSFGVGLTLDDGLRIVFATLGVHVGGACGGFNGGTVDISACATGMKISDLLQPGVNNREVFLGSDFTVDSNTNTGLLVANNSVVLLQLDGTWVCGNAGPGVSVQPSTGVKPQVRMTGCEVYLNGGNGVENNDGELIISGGSYRNNGGGSGGHGIWLVTSDGSPTLIAGARIHDNAGNGVRIEAGNNSFVVQGNVLSGNVGAAIVNNAGNGPTKVIRDNAGYVTENFGVATVTSGTGGVVVAHGLSEVPANVQITWKDGLQAGVTASVTSVNATNFSITLSAGATADRGFYWRASVGG